MMRKLAGKDREENKEVQEEGQGRKIKKTEAEIKGDSEVSETKITMTLRWPIIIFKKRR